MQSTTHNLKSSFKQRSKIPLPLLTALILVFGLGFVPQLLGFLSLTSTNIIVLFFLLIFTAKKFNTQIISRTTLAYFIVTIYIAICGLSSGSTFTGFAIYAYYLLTTYLALKSARFAVEKKYLTEGIIFKYLHAYLIIQIVFCVFQFTFSTQISQFSKMPVSPVDTASGTFFLASDASLCFFCLISTIFSFGTNQNFKNKYLTLFLCSIIVSLTDSKAIQLIFLASACILISYDIISKIKGYNKIILTLSPFVLLGTVLIAFNNFSWIQILAQDTLTEAYDKRFASIGASRLAPIGEMFYGDNPLLGHGLLAYYNPIDKNWLYNSGSSLFYTIFIDCGLPGIFILYSFFLYLILKNEKRLLYAALYFLAFFTFAFFNFALTDIGAIFSLGAYLTLQKKILRS